MLEKQKQTVGNGSTAIQTSGNVSITPYLELRAIFLDLFELNFPRVQEVARTIADERINGLLEELKASFEKHQHNIDPTKFTDPAMQYEMQAMAVDVARKGDKSNLDLLCELFSTMMSKDCPELIELISSEARRILPILSRTHINYLSLEVLAGEASISAPNLRVLDHVIGQSLEFIHGVRDLTASDLQYVSCSGAIVRKGIIHVGVVPTFIREIPELKGKNADQLLAFSKEQGLANLTELLELIQHCGVGTFDLSAVGRLIGWLNLSKITQVDIKDLFK